MSLIQRQESLVKAIEPIYFQRIISGRSGMDGRSAGMRAKAKRLHAESMIKDGYSKVEAWASANDCDAVAFRNADSKAFEIGFGVAA